MSETFTKKNDYTLTVTNDESRVLQEVDDVLNVQITSSLEKTFNFLSAQVTTVTRERIFQPRGSSSSGAAASVSIQMIIQNFSDIQSPEELKLMHRKLVELGGAPPELSDIMPILDKKNPGIGR